MRGVRTLRASPALRTVSRMRAHRIVLAALLAAPAAAAAQVAGPDSTAPDPAAEIPDVVLNPVDPIGDDAEQDGLSNGADTGVGATDTTGLAETPGMTGSTGVAGQNATTGTTGSATGGTGVGTGIEGAGDLEQDEADDLGVGTGANPLGEVDPLGEIDRVGDVNPIGAVDPIGDGLTPEEQADEADELAPMD
jgi:hypothetical protein